MIGLPAIWRLRRWPFWFLALSNAFQKSFSLSLVWSFRNISSSNSSLGIQLGWVPNTNQEWLLPPNSGLKADTSGSALFEHRITVVFTTAIYGTFRQSVVFDLGSEPVMVKHLCVDVVPVADADKIKEIKKVGILDTFLLLPWLGKNSVP